MRLMKNVMGAKFDSGNWEKMTHPVQFVSETFRALTWAKTTHQTPRNRGLFPNPLGITKNDPPAMGENGVDCENVPGKMEDGGLRNRTST